MNLEVLTGADNLWYNLDNGENISFLSGDSPLLSVDSGAHKIYVFANNSYGVSSRNVSFFIDLDAFMVY